MDIFWIGQQGERQLLRNKILGHPELCDNKVMVPQVACYSTSPGRFLFVANLNRQRDFIPENSPLPLHHRGHRQLSQYYMTFLCQGLVSR